MLQEISIKNWFIPSRKSIAAHSSIPSDSVFDFQKYSIYSNSKYLNKAEQNFSSSGCKIELSAIVLMDKFFNSGINYSLPEFSNRNIKHVSEQSVVPDEKVRIVSCT